ncbi:R3H domain-containing nucleic acid-binding protein [Pseudokineococcus basanitobsidens]|uniref:R3H domain-containing nucleic acid-binding protein n=1 Tax=Pseudokineococcus basanitobsidens TaxID=1926649 RepID=A0ABU8RL24_9ACTN
MSEQDGALDAQTTGPATADVPAPATRDADGPPVDDLAASGEPDGEQADGGQPDGEASAPSRRARLEQEGDVAADYLEELLDIADLDGDLDIDVEDGRASVSVLADEASPTSLRRLVGSDGEVLEALQELTRLAVQARTGERSRLLLDVGGYRKERQVVLERLARGAVEDVRAGTPAVHLEPMNPYERKIVHDVVADAGLVSESEGAAAERHVVVTAAP